MKHDMILVVEDDMAIRNLISTALKLEHYEYHAVYNGNQALIEASSQNPDIILLDLGLPDMDGIDVIKRIRSWSNVPIIVISARIEDKDKIDALDAGADDYITKPFSTTELLARIRSTYRRIRYLKNIEIVENSVFINGKLKIDYSLQMAYLGQGTIHLTPIEYKILCLLAQNIGRVLTHAYMTKEIWGSAFESDVASLRVHVATLRKKIDVSNKDNPYITTHVGIGYCMQKLEDE